MPDLDLNALLGVGPRVAAKPAATQADVDAMASLAKTAKATSSSLAPVASRLVVKRSAVDALRTQIAAAKGGR